MFGRPPIIRDAVRAALVSLNGEHRLGVTHGQLVEASGAKKKAVTMALLALKGEALCFAIGSNRHARYFASAEAMAAAAADVAALNQQHREAMRRAQLDRANARERAKTAERRKSRVVAPKPAKSASRPTERPSIPPAPKSVEAPVQIKRQKPLKWSDMPTVIPPNVKVTKCPGCKPRTFAPPPWFRGEFTNEWRELRGGRS